jgi:ribose 5-phosphate isomerase A
MDPREDEKRVAAETAVSSVEDGMTVGLGTGTTVGHFLPALARRGLSLTCVATSPATEDAARGLGLTVHPFDLLDELDIAVDGADQVGPDLWLIKGGGGAHTREKVVAAAARKFLVIVASDKIVARLQPPVPVEVLGFGVRATVRLLSTLGPFRRQEKPPTPDGNILMEYHGAVEDPRVLSEALSMVPGVVGHGLFEPRLVSEVLVGQGDGSVRRMSGPKKG